MCPEIGKLNEYVLIAHFFFQKLSLLSSNRIGYTGLWGLVLHKAVHERYIQYNTFKKYHTGIYLLTILG